MHRRRVCRVWKKKMEEQLPPSLPFTPIATMFKLSEPDSQTVECVACGAMFPLRDLLTYELEESECPRCSTTVGMYYAGKPHRAVGQW
jgi:uncharacterized paraquat-inducible protein A